MLNSKCSRSNAALRLAIVLSAIGAVALSAAEPLKPGLAAEPQLQPTNESPGEQAPNMQARSASKAFSWRETTINRLRTVDLGTFDYHAYQVGVRQLRLADMLVGRLSEAEYATQQYGPDFLDLYGVRNAGEAGALVDWAATSPDPFAREKSAYGSFGFSIPLAAAYWKTQDPVYMRKWFAIAADFARNQRRAVERVPVDVRRTDNAPWAFGALSCLHQGTRAIAMVRCLAVFAKSLPSANDGSKPAWADILRPVEASAASVSLGMIPEDDLADIVHSLAVDHPQLLLDGYYQPGAPPNQRTEGLVALLTLATVFPDADGMGEVAHKAGEAMSECLTNGFHKDGGMLEQSLNYNVVEAERLRQLGRMLQRTPPPWLPLLAEKLRGFHRLIVGISTPMHELPVIGNNTSNPPAAWKGEEVRRQWFDRRAADSPKIDTAGLGFASIAFPYSGYYAMRRDWGWDSPYLFMTNARPTRGHKSMDNLALEVHAFGRPLLVRGGPPPYGVKFLPEDRRSDALKIEEYFDERSSYKLNTVIVDGHSQARVAESVTAAHEEPVPGLWHASTAFDLVDGRYGLGYGPPDTPAAVDSSVIHQRRVIYVRDLSCWVVSDAMLCGVGKEHDFTQIWKFPPFRDANDAANCPVCGFKPEQVVSGDGSIRTVDANGPNLWLYQFSNQPLAYRKHIGETDPYRGWYARFIGDLVPSVDMHATWRASGQRRAQPRLRLRHLRLAVRRLRRQ